MRRQKYGTYIYTESESHRGPCRQLLKPGKIREARVLKHAIEINLESVSLSMTGNV